MNRKILVLGLVGLIDCSTGCNKIMDYSENISLERDRLEKQINFEVQGIPLGVGKETEQGKDSISVVIRTGNERNEIYNFSACRSNSFARSHVEAIVDAEINDGDKDIIILRQYKICKDYEKDKDSVFFNCVIADSLKVGYCPDE
jgi:hypothetical protein